MKITHISVDGFWGRRDIRFELKNDVNLIIGKNGSGKTQLLNLIIAILTVNTSGISEIDFRRVEIGYTKNKRPNYLIVDKEVLEIERTAVRRTSKSAKASKEMIIVRVPVIKYQINGKSYIIHDKERYYTDHLSHDSDHQTVAVGFLQEMLSQSFKIVFLSVNRKLDEPMTRRLSERYNNPGITREILDDKINDLLQRVGNNRVRLLNILSEINKKGEKELVTSLLFNDGGTRRLTSENFDTKKAKLRLHSTLSDLEFMDQEIDQKIEDIFADIEELVPHQMEILSDVTKHRNDVNRLFNVLGFVSKLDTINRISSKTEKDKNKAMAAWDYYVETLDGFMLGKNFRFDEDGKFKAFKDEKAISIEKLSSGEKQIFVMLTEAYLESQSDHIFFADEPEISLHLEWQEKIMPSLVNLNKKAQYIMVTHSPEIAGCYPNNLFDMEDISQ